MGNSGSQLAGIHPFRDPSDSYPDNYDSPHRHQPLPVIQFNPMIPLTSDDPETSPQQQAQSQQSHHSQQSQSQQMITISSGWLDQSSPVSKQFDELLIVKAPTPPPRRFSSSQDPSPGGGTGPRTPKRTWRNLSLKTLISRPDLNKLGTLLKWKKKRRSQEVYPVPPDAEKPSPPSRPEVFHEQDEYFLLRWDPPAYDGGLPIIGYIIQHLELGLPQPPQQQLDEFGFEMPLKDDTQCWYSSEPGQVSSTEVLLNNLIPGTTYQFRIIAENLLGYSTPGDLSPPIVFNPRGDLDDWFCPPVLVIPLNESYNAIEHERLQLTIEITGQPYPVVHWYDRHDSELGTEPGGRYITLSSGQRRSLTIAGVECSDSGVIRCVGENEKGVIECKCTVLVEAPPHIRRIRKVDEDVPVPTFESDGIGGGGGGRVTPGDPDATTTGNMIFQSGELAILKFAFSAFPTPNVAVYHEADLVDGQETEDGPVVKTPKVTTEIFDNEITVKIAGVDRQDRGEWVVRLNNALGEDAAVVLVTVADRPSRPGKPDVLQLSDNTVILKWGLPDDDGGCPITGYTVQYFRSEWGVWLKACTTKNPYTKIRDLIPGSKYKFRIRAENLYGVSDPSAESVELLITDVGSTLKSLDHGNEDGENSLLMRTVLEEEEEVDAVGVEEDDPAAVVVTTAAAETELSSTGESGPSKPRRTPSSSVRGSTASLLRVSTSTMTDLKGLNSSNKGTSGGGGVATGTSAAASSPSSNDPEGIDLIARLRAFEQRPKRDEDEVEIKFKKGDSGDFKNQLTYIASATYGIVFERDALMIFGNMDDARSPPNYDEDTQIPKSPAPPLLRVSLQPQVIVLPDDYEDDSEDMMLQPPEIAPRRARSPSPLLSNNNNQSRQIFADEPMMSSLSSPPALPPRQQQQRPFVRPPFEDPDDLPLNTATRTLSQQELFKLSTQPLGKFSERFEEDEFEGSSPGHSPMLARRLAAAGAEESAAAGGMMQQQTKAPEHEEGEAEETRDQILAPPVRPTRHHHHHHHHHLHGASALSSSQQHEITDFASQLPQEQQPPVQTEPPPPPQQQQQHHLHCPVPIKPQLPPERIPIVIPLPPDQQPKKLYSRAEIIRSAAPSNLLVGSSTASTPYSSLYPTSSSPAASDDAAGAPPAEEDEELEEDPELLKVKVALAQEDDHEFDDLGDEDDEDMLLSYGDNSYSYDFDKLQQEYDEDKKRGMVSRQDSGVSGKSVGAGAGAGEGPSRQASLAEAEEIPIEEVVMEGEDEQQRYTARDVTRRPGGHHDPRARSSEVGGDRTAVAGSGGAPMRTKWGVVDAPEEHLATRDPFERAQSEVVVRSSHMPPRTLSVGSEEGGGSSSRHHQPSPSPGSRRQSSGGSLYLGDRFTDYIAMKASSRNKRVGSSLRSLTSSASSRYSSNENVGGGGAGAGSVGDPRQAATGSRDSGRSSMTRDYYYSSSGDPTTQDSTMTTTTTSSSHHHGESHDTSTTPTNTSSMPMHKPLLPKRSFEKPPLQFRQFDAKTEGEGVKRLESSTSALGLTGSGMTRTPPSSSSSTTTTTTTTSSAKTTNHYDIVHPLQKPTTPAGAVMMQVRAKEKQQLPMTPTPGNDEPAGTTHDDDTTTTPSRRCDTTTTATSDQVLTTSTPNKPEQPSPPDALVTETPPPPSSEKVTTELPEAAAQEIMPQQSPPEDSLPLLSQQPVLPPPPHESSEFVEQENKTVEIPVTTGENEAAALLPPREQKILPTPARSEIRSPSLPPMALNPDDESLSLPEEHVDLSLEAAEARDAPETVAAAALADQLEAVRDSSPAAVEMCSGNNGGVPLPLGFISTPDIYASHRPDTRSTGQRKVRSASETDFTWIPDSALKQRADTYMAGGVDPDEITTEEDYSGGGGRVGGGGGGGSEVFSDLERGDFSAISELSEDVMGVGVGVEQREEECSGGDYGGRVPAVFEREVPREREDVRRGYRLGSFGGGGGGDTDVEEELELEEVEVETEYNMRRRGRSDELVSTDDDDKNRDKLQQDAEALATTVEVMVEAEKVGGEREGVAKEVEEEKREDDERPIIEQSVCAEDLREYEEEEGKVEKSEIGVTDQETTTRPDDGSGVAAAGATTTTTTTADDDVKVMMISEEEVVGVVMQEKVGAEVEQIAENNQIDLEAGEMGTVVQEVVEVDKDDVDEKDYATEEGSVGTPGVIATTTVSEAVGLDTESLGEENRGTMALEEGGGGGGGEPQQEFTQESVILLGEPPSASSQQQQITTPGHVAVVKDEEQPGDGFTGSTIDVENVSVSEQVVVSITDAQQNEGNVRDDEPPPVHDDEIERTAVAPTEEEATPGGENTGNEIEQEEKTMPEHGGDDGVVGERIEREEGKSSHHHEQIVENLDDNDLVAATTITVPGEEGETETATTTEESLPSHQRQPNDDDVVLPEESNVLLEEGEQNVEQEETEEDTGRYYDDDDGVEPREYDDEEGVFVRGEDGELYEVYEYYPDEEEGEEDEEGRIVEIGDQQEGEFVLIEEEGEEEGEVYEEEEGEDEEGRVVRLIGDDEDGAEYYGVEVDDDRLEGYTGAGEHQQRSATANPTSTRTSSVKTLAEFDTFLEGGEGTAAAARSQQLESLLSKLDKFLNEQDNEEGGGGCGVMMIRGDDEGIEEEGGGEHVEDLGVVLEEEQRGLVEASTSDEASTLFFGEEEHEHEVIQSGSSTDRVCDKLMVVMTKEAEVDKPTCLEQENLNEEHMTECPKPSTSDVVKDLSVSDAAATATHTVEEDNHEKDIPTNDKPVVKKDEDAAEVIATEPGERASGITETGSETVITEPLAQISERPAETSEPPAEISEPPAEISEPPAEISEPPAEILEPPAEITDNPRETTEPLLEIANTAAKKLEPGPEEIAEQLSETTTKDSPELTDSSLEIKEPSQEFQEIGDISTRIITNVSLPQDAETLHEILEPPAEILEPPAEILEPPAEITDNPPETTTEPLRELDNNAAESLGPCPKITETPEEIAESLSETTTTKDSPELTDSRPEIKEPSQELQEIAAIIPTGIIANVPPQEAAETLQEILDHPPPESTEPRSEIAESQKIIEPEVTETHPGIIEPSPAISEPPTVIAESSTGIIEISTGITTEHPQETAETLHEILAHPPPESMEPLSEKLAQTIVHPAAVTEPPPPEIPDPPTTEECSTESTADSPPQITPTPEVTEQSITEPIPESSDPEPPQQKITERKSPQQITPEPTLETETLPQITERPTDLLEPSPPEMITDEPLPEITESPPEITESLPETIKHVPTEITSEPSQEREEPPTEVTEPLQEITELIAAPEGSEPPRQIVGPTSLDTTEPPPPESIMEHSQEIPEPLQGIPETSQEVVTDPSPRIITEPLLQESRVVATLEAIFTSPPPDFTDSPLEEMGEPLPEAATTPISETTENPPEITEPPAQSSTESPPEITETSSEKTPPPEPSLEIREETTLENTDPLHQEILIAPTSTEPSKPPSPEITEAPLEISTEPTLEKITPSESYSELSPGVIVRSQEETVPPVTGIAEPPSPESSKEPNEGNVSAEPPTPQANEPPPESIEPAQEITKSPPAALLAEAQEILIASNSEITEPQKVTEPTPEIITKPHPPQETSEPPSEITEPRLEMTETSDCKPLDITPPTTQQHSTPPSLPPLPPLSTTISTVSTSPLSPRAAHRPPATTPTPSSQQPQHHHPLRITSHERLAALSTVIEEEPPNDTLPIPKPTTITPPPTTPSPRSSPQPPITIPRVTSQMGPPSSYLPTMSAYYTLPATPLLNRSRSSTPVAAILREQLLASTSSLPRSTPPQTPVPTPTPTSRHSIADDEEGEPPLEEIDITEIKRRIIIAEQTKEDHELATITNPQLDTNNDDNDNNRSGSLSPAPTTEISPFMNYVFNAAFYLMLSPMLFFIDSLQLALLCLLVVGAIHFCFLRFNNHQQQPPDSS